MTIARIAATELKTKLDNGVEFTAQMVDDLVSEFDIDRPTLMREFRTITGSTPMEYTPKKFVDMSEKMIQAAQRRASDLHASLRRVTRFGTRYTDTDGRTREFEVGKIFTRKGNTYAFVGWQYPGIGEISGRRRTHMVRVSDATHHEVLGIIFPRTRK